MLVGASLSLSGRFQGQGEEARDGLRLWVDRAQADASNAVPRLIILDDGSRADLAQGHVRRLLAEEGVDVLVGPYSSGLVLAVAPIAAAAGALLWNHGGASDAIDAAARGHQLAIVFGNEKTGLTREELEHAESLVRIPMAADQPSINLAQAVQVLAYELYCAALERRHESR